MVKLIRYDRLASNLSIDRQFVAVFAPGGSQAAPTRGHPMLQHLFRLGASVVLSVDLVCSFTFYSSIRNLLHFLCMIVLACCVWVAGDVAKRWSRHSGRRIGGAAAKRATASLFTYSKTQTKSTTSTTTWTKPKPKTTKTTTRTRTTNNNKRKSKWIRHFYRAYLHTDVANWLFHRRLACAAACTETPHLNQQKRTLHCRGEPARADRERRSSGNRRLLVATGARRRRQPPGRADARVWLRDASTPCGARSGTLVSQPHVASVDFPLGGARCAHRSPRVGAFWRRFDRVSARTAADRAGVSRVSCARCGPLWLFRQSLLWSDAQRYWCVLGSIRFSALWRAACATDTAFLFEGNQQSEIVIIFVFLNTTLMYVFYFF